MPIDSKIREIIKENNYITIDDMMRQALSVNTQSYYKAIQDIGPDGDFITSPEISQLFGEIIAIWAIQKWQDLGSPKFIAIIELGPGQGKLMQDFLRAAHIVPEFYVAIAVYLLDINPHFIQKQQINLKQFNKKIHWIKSIEEIPSIPSIVVANEFFDALPVKQYIKIKTEWYESIMTLEPISGHIKYDKLPIPGTLQKQLTFEHSEAQDGAVLEESIESLKILRFISEHITKHTGAALIIDYGYYIPSKARQSTQYNSTLQAIKDHSYQSIIDTLGESDLTTHVDFYNLTKSANEYGVSQTNFCSQREFLIKYGIELRLKTLQDKMRKQYKLSSNSITGSVDRSDQQKTRSMHEILANQVDRLIANDKMGNLFKVLEINNNRLSS